MACLNSSDEVFLQRTVQTPGQNSGRGITYLCTFRETCNSYSLTLPIYLHFARMEIAASL